MHETLSSVPLPFLSFLVFFFIFVLFCRSEGHPVFSKLTKSDPGLTLF